MKPWDPNPSQPLWLAAPQTADGEPPAAAAVALRPFGYLIYAAIFWVCLAVVVALYVGMVAFLVDGAGDVPPWSELVHRIWTMQSPVLAVLMWVVFVLVSAPLSGALGLFHLPLMTGATALLATTAFVRSLNPAYRGEKLTGTSWARPSDTIGFKWGGPDGRGMAMSCLPVRRTAFTSAVVKAYHAGWFIKGDTFIAGFVLGVAHLASLLFLYPGVPTALRVVFAVVGLGCLVLSVVLFVRALRRRYGSAAAVRR